VIPNRSLAEALVRRYTRRNQDAEVVIVRKTAGTLDVDNDLTADDGVVIYRGQARVYLVQGPVTYALGEEPQYFSSTYVSIPDTYPADGDTNNSASETWTKGDPVHPQVDDVVEVHAHHDPYTVGRRFRVTDVEAGAQITSFIRMQVAGIQRYRGWTPNDPQAAEFDIPEEWVV
jgi:hypothetical protein